MAFKLGNIQIFPNNYYFDFMKWRKITIGISVILVILSLCVIGIKGLNYSIDFLGGAEIEIDSIQKGFTRDQLKSALDKNGFSHAELTTTSALSNANSSQSFLIRLQRDKGEDENATTTRASSLIKSLKTQFGESNLQVAKVTNISGKVGKEDEFKGYMSLLLACVGILIYIAFRFDSRFAPGAVLCLVHNVILALGFMTWLGRPFTVTSIAAFLTSVGYSINDTVIVYDRIRESRLLQPKLPMVDIVNRSISQTMNRTVLTSITGILALLVLSILGGGSIRDFAVTMLVGVVVGTYSSIYVASPLTLMMDAWFSKLGFKSKENNQKSISEKPKDFAPPIMLRNKTKIEK